MSLPLVYWGPDKEQYSNYADPATGGEPTYRLGQQLVLRDGRKFRFCRGGAAALVAGEVEQAAANTANNLEMAVAAAVAVNATTVPVTLGGGTIAQDEYMDGTLVLTGTTANGGGLAYAIAEHHGAVGSGTAWTVPLGAGVGVALAMTTSNFASAIHNPYRNVIRIPVTTITQVPVGVAAAAAPINTWGWLQTRGPASVFQHGTVVLGQPVGYVATAAAVDPIAATTTAQLGLTQAVGSHTFTPVFLTIDG